MTTDKRPCSFTTDERVVLLDAFERHGGHTPSRIECEDIAQRFTHARQGTAEFSLDAKPPPSASALGLRSLPSFELEEVDAWLMSNADAAMQLFADDLWMPVVVDTPPEQRAARLCKARSTTAVTAPVVSGLQIKVWFENRRCSLKRERLGVPARRQRAKK